jgi:hypothetical protein
VNSHGLSALHVLLLKGEVRLAETRSVRHEMWGFRMRSRVSYGCHGAPAGGILGRLRMIGEYQCVPSVGKWPTHLFAGQCDGWVSARAMLVTRTVR